MYIKTSTDSSINEHPPMLSWWVISDLSPELPLYCLRALQAILCGRTEVTGMNRAH